MPLRIAPFRAALHSPRPRAGLHSPRLFHATALRRHDIDSKNHYEILNLQTNASPADIKKSFYTLSKTHHPDHNQSDPNASRRFVRISEAYGVLGNTEKRARYDRDVLRLHEAKHHHHHHHRAGSYSSTTATSGPAGGRPASGLSRRRGTFRGPPPSFYRSGGWGEHGARRAAAHEESTGGGGNASANSSSAHGHKGQQQQESYSGWYTAHGAGGMGPGQEPFGKGSSGADIPHFDRAAKAAHTRTQEWVASRRFRRGAEGGTPFPRASSDFGEIGGFFAVLAVLGVAVGLPYVVLRGWSTGNKEKKSKKQAGADGERVVKG